MCRSMGWTGASILMNRWFYDRLARTWCDGQWPGGSRNWILFEFTMGCAANGRFSIGRLLKQSAGSRKPGPNSMNTGAGAVVQ